MPFLVSTVVRGEDPPPLLAENGFGSFASFMDYGGGRLVSLQRGRTVTRMECGGRAFYLKRNRFNWREFIKTLSRLQWPPRNAVGEWESICAVKRLGIRTVTPVAAGEKRLFGLEIASFIVTEELYGAEPLENVLRRELSQPLSRPKREWKYAMLRGVAQIARQLHANGLCHQDFYLGHIFRDQTDILYLIDLQRVRRRNRTPRRSIVKDLGQLNFSADCVGGISRADRMRFYLEYLGLRSLGPAEKKLARSIAAKTDRIARHTVKLLQRRRRRREIP